MAVRSPSLLVRGSSDAVDSEEVMEKIQVNAKDLRLVRVLTLEQSEVFRDLITKYHSYVKSTTVGGRQLNYLVMADSVAVGCIGLGSLPMPTKPIIDYLE